jgi:uncharacterized Zn finger protein (UPF0148 family)
LSLAGTFAKQLGAPCPRCRRATWMALIPGTGKVECPECESTWATVGDYMNAVVAAWGAQYERELRNVQSSALAYGVSQ